MLISNSTAVVFVWISGWLNNSKPTRPKLQHSFPTNPAFCLVCLSLTVSACYKWMSSKWFAVESSYTNLNGLCAFLIFFYITPGTEKNETIYTTWINLTIWAVTFNGIVWWNTTSYKHVCFSILAFSLISECRDLLQGCKVLYSSEIC